LLRLAFIGPPFSINQTVTADRSGQRWGFRRDHGTRSPGARPARHRAWSAACGTWLRRHHRLGDQRPAAPLGLGI